MTRGKLLLFLAVSFLAMDAHAAPKPAECPYPGSVVYDLDKVEEGLKSAPSCDAAFELFSTCMMGATSDVRMSGIVIERCEADFKAKLSKSKARAYGKDLNGCERKYRRQSGSEARAMEALCFAEVARSYSRRSRSMKPPRRS
jgi:hypothetical protein